MLGPCFVRTAADLDRNAQVLAQLLGNRQHRGEDRRSPRGGARGSRPRCGRSRQAAGALGRHGPVAHRFGAVASTARGSGTRRPRLHGRGCRPRDPRAAAADCDHVRRRFRARRRRAGAAGQTCRLCDPRPPAIGGGGDTFIASETIFAVGALAALLMGALVSLVLIGLALRPLRQGDDDCRRDRRGRPAIDERTFAPGTRSVVWARRSTG